MTKYENFVVRPLVGIEWEKRDDRSGEKTSDELQEQREAALKEAEKYLTPEQIEEALKRLP
jgi:hypothetical protein